MINTKLPQTQNVNSSNEEMVQQEHRIVVLWFTKFTSFGKENLRIIISSKYKFTFVNATDIMLYDFNKNEKKN